MFLRVDELRYLAITILEEAVEIRSLKRVFHLIEDFKKEAEITEVGLRGTNFMLLRFRSALVRSLLIVFMNSGTENHIFFFSSHFFVFLFFNFPNFFCIF